MTGLIVEGRQPLRDGGEVLIDGVDVGTLDLGQLLAGAGARHRPGTVAR